MNARCAVVLFCLGCCLSGQTSASSNVSFKALGDLSGGAFFSQAYDVSDDGSVVVGRSVGGNGYVAVRWTNGVIEVLDHSEVNPVGAAYGISGDGSVIVGYGYSSRGLEACRWIFRPKRGRNAVGQRVWMGDLSDEEYNSIAMDASLDGSVVVGNGQSKKGAEAFIWTDEHGMRGLGDLRGDIFHSYANDVSDDGRVIAGTSYSHNGFEAYIWTRKSKMVGLGDIPGGNFRSVTAAVSGDGSTVVGHSDTSNGTKAFRWTKEDGMVSLGDLQGGFSMAADVSENGSVIVGFAEGAKGITAFVWDNVHGMRSLNQVLGSAVPEGWRLMHAEGISRDGRTIVGYGVNPDGYLEAFIAQL